MGGAGVWHTSLHYPDLWAAVEVGAGDNTSHRMPVLQSLASVQQAMCRIFDNMYEWALNAYNIPFVSYVGENDRSHAKHNAAREQLIRDGIQFEGERLSLKAANAPSIQYLVAANTDTTCTRRAARSSTRICTSGSRWGARFPTTSAS